MENVVSMTIVFQKGTKIRTKSQILAAILDFRGHQVQIRGGTSKNLKERIKIGLCAKFHKSMTKTHN